MEAASGFEPENNGFADRCLTSWLCRLWSGKRDSNPRLQPWQGCTLPLSYSRSSIFFVKIGALVKGEKDGFRFSVVKPLKTGVQHLSLGSGKEIEFPLTLTLSPIGGEGITNGAH